jgi:hypothetical protein
MKFIIALYFAASLVFGALDFASQQNEPDAASSKVLAAEDPNLVPNSGFFFSKCRLCFSL